MKKYDFWVNKQNTPHLKLYTVLIGLFNGFMGLNAFIVAWCTQITDEKTINVLYIFGVLMCITTPSAITDLRKSHRDLGAVITTGSAHLIVTGIMAFLVNPHYLVIIVYFVEWCICGAYIVHYNKARNNK